jgi:hypothetical protein
MPTKRNFALKPLLLAVVAICVLLNAGVRAQQETSLGDAAREIKQEKAAQRKAEKVFTNDDLSYRNGLDEETDKFCERLKRRGDAAGRDNCAVLRIEMGSEYQNTVNEYSALRRQLCDAENSGRPKDLGLVARSKDLEAKFNALKTDLLFSPEKYSRAEMQLCQAQQTAEIKSISRHGVYEMRQAEEVRERFEECVKAAQARLEQATLRVQRVHADSLRFYEGCR